MEKVGFIGVGAMGGAMVAQLRQKDVPVLVYDRNPAVVDKMCALGAEAADSVLDVANQVEIVFACLPTPEICLAVAFGPEGAAAGSRIKIYIEMSTLGGACAVELAEGLAKKDIAFLDAPVVGGTVAANAGTLGVLVAGPTETFERAKFALEAIAGRLFYLGEKAGISQVGKVMNNAVAYAALIATCEALAVGLKAGLDMETAVAIINQGSGANFFSQRVFPSTIMQGQYGGTGAIEIGLKDVKLFLAEVARLGVEAPMASQVSALQGRIVASGPAGRDTLETFHYFTDLMGMPRGG